MQCMIMLDNEIILSYIPFCLLKFSQAICPFQRVIAIESQESDYASGAISLCVLCLI